MSLEKCFVGVLLLLGSFCMAQSEGGQIGDEGDGLLVPQAQSSSWFSENSFNLPDFSMHPRKLPEEALHASKFSITPQAPLTLKSLFVERAGGLDPLRAEGRFDLTGGNYLSFGYDLDNQHTRYSLNDRFMLRESIYGPGNVNFQNLSAHLHEPDFTKTLTYGGHFNLVPGTSVDVGVRYDQNVLRPGGLSDDEVFYPRIGLTYEFTNRFRFQASHGRFAEYRVFELEENVDRGLQLLNGLQPLTENELFDINRAAHTAAALEYDLTKHSTLRVEGFESKADRGMNLSLRHKR